MTEIKGTINFTLSKTDDGQVSLNYDQNIENDLGAVAIASSVAQTIVDHFANSRQKAQGDKNKYALDRALKSANKSSKEISNVFQFLLMEFENWTKFKESIPKPEETAESVAEPETKAE